MKHVNLVRNFLKHDYLLRTDFFKPKKLKYIKYNISPDSNSIGGLTNSQVNASNTINKTGLTLNADTNSHTDAEVDISLKNNLKSLKKGQALNSPDILSLLFSLYEKRQFSLLADHLNSSIISSNISRTLKQFLITGLWLRGASGDLDQTTCRKLGLVQYGHLFGPTKSAVWEIYTGIKKIDELLLSRAGKHDNDSPYPHEIIENQYKENFTGYEKRSGSIDDDEYAPTCLDAEIILSKTQNLSLILFLALQGRPKALKKVIGQWGQSLASFDEGRAVLVSASDHMGLTWDKWATAVKGGTRNGETVVVDLAVMGAWIRAGKLGAALRVFKKAMNRLWWIHNYRDEPLLYAGKMEVNDLPLNVLCELRLWRESLIACDSIYHSTNAILCETAVRPFLNQVASRYKNESRIIAPFFSMVAEHYCSLLRDLTLKFNESSNANENENEVDSNNIIIAANAITYIFGELNNIQQTQWLLQERETILFAFGIGGNSNSCDQALQALTEPGQRKELFKIILQGVFWKEKDQPEREKLLSFSKAVLKLES